MAEVASHTRRATLRDCCWTILSAGRPLETGMSLVTKTVAILASQSKTLQEACEITRRAKVTTECANIAPFCNNSQWTCKVAVPADSTLP